MSQTQQSEYRSGETNHKNTENAQFEADFGLSWGDINLGATFSAAGTAAHNGIQKLGEFMKTTLAMTKIIAVTAVALFSLATVRILGELHLAES